MIPIDLSGQIFGHVKAIKPTDSRYRGSIIWECVCDCGNTCRWSAKELKEETDSRSCGCTNPWAKDLKGQIFGKLEVLEITEERQKHGKGQGGSVVWKCKCHGCSSVVNLSSRTLLINDATTCGCRGLQPGDAALNCLLTSYKKWAKEKDVEWRLTRKEADKLFKSNCHYCGAEPKNKSNSRSYKESYIYNGMDAVDGNKGYTLDNVVSCCKKCNEVKLAMTLEEFENYIYTLYNHYFVNEGKYTIYSLPAELEHLIEYDNPRGYGEGEAPFNQIYSAYRTHAKNKKVNWKLTRDQAKKLFKSNCHYCGARPSNLCNPKKCIGSFQYNGIDAINNAEDYTIGNAVPCCTKCNKSKRAMSLIEWENYIYKLYNHYFTSKKPT